MSDWILELEEFVFGAPLYSRLKLSVANARSFVATKDVSIRGYCASCKQTSIFRNSSADPMRDAFGRAPEIEGNFTVVLECQKDTEHTLALSLNSTQLSLPNSGFPNGWAIELIKTGQYPSILDIAKSNYEHLDGVIAELDYFELNRATGLASHGANVAAFVYLRRIFERLIYTTAEKSGKLGDDFSKLRMAQKVARLSDELPEIVSQEKSLYPSLSSGLHSWTEEECGTMFEILREAILLTFEEQKAADELRARRARISDALQKRT